MADTEGLDGETIKQEAYDSFKAELSSRWRNRPTAGCDEQRAPVAEEDSQTVDGDTIKREAWEQSVRDLQDAWRR